MGGEVVRFFKLQITNYKLEIRNSKTLVSHIETKNLTLNPRREYLASPDVSSWRFV